MRIAKRAVFLACVSLLGAVGLLAACSSRGPDESPGAQQAAVADPIPGGDWMARVEQQLAEREYQASHNGTGLQAPNRKHGLRTYFEPTGIRVHDRTAGEDSELVGLSVAGVGRGSALSLVSPGEVSSAGARVEIRRDAFVEWYVNSAEGLEQGFTWTDRPEGEGPLAIELALSGASASVRGDELLFQAPSGRKLRYGALWAKDAAGRSLVARMELSREGRVRLEVEDAGAEYPVVLDPLLTGAADTLIQSDQASAFLGTSVADAGDVNGDGYADVIVGAVFYDAGQTNEGAAFVFLGSASGIADGNPMTAAAQLESNQANALLGGSNTVAGAGDVNGDGYDDVIVGAPAYDSGQTDEGAAFVFLGSGSGIADGDPTTAATQLESNQASAYLGYSVAGAGDVDGDGFADVIVGAYQYDAGHANEGVAFVFRGSAAGIAAGNPATAAAQLESNQAGAYLGSSVSGAGDMNGDGYADVIVGAHGWTAGQFQEGAAFVFLGSASGVEDGNPMTAAARIESDQSSAELGFSVAGAGDVNGDGYADIIIGAHFFDAVEPGEGAAFLFLGSATLDIPNGTPATAAAQLESNQEEAFLGTSVAGAGDINGDGYADVIVGASAYDADQASEGAAFVFLGSASGISDGNPATAAAQLESNQAGATLGRSVAGGGDVNGDGYADVIVGADGFDAVESGEGAAFVYLGGASGIADGNPATATAQLESNQAGSVLGHSVAGAGDVNGDGYADVIVGAWDYDSGSFESGAAFVFHGTANGIADGNPATAARSILGGGGGFGSSVAGAGDVNGDGYADVIIGAPGTPSSPGEAFVFAGGANGIVWDRPSLAAAGLTSDQPGSSFGESVAGAGDVNGDGYADVIVGAQNYDAGTVDEGAAFVFLGSSMGIADGTPATAAAQIESNQLNVRLGSHVAGIGDSNGDGYSDIVVGCNNPSASAFVFEGSATGIADGNPVTAAARLTGANFWSVAGAGDVNGDGYADLIVGSYFFSAGQQQEGAAFVFHGGAGGISDGTPATAAAQLESDQAFAQLGYAVAGAGDVNGDGYADVIVGARNFAAVEEYEGAAFVFLGSASGVSDGNPATAAAQLESNVASAQLGISVSGAGDVNGDGYADVIAGAPYWREVAQAAEGAAFIFVGNSEGRPVRTRQKRGDSYDLPVQAWGDSGNPGVYRAELLASHPEGSGRVKAEFDVCPTGVPFGHASCTNTKTSSWATVGGAAPEALLTQTLSTSPSNALYRWRARVLHAPKTGALPAKPPHGPWRRVNAQATEADIRTVPEPDRGLLLASGIALLFALIQRRRKCTMTATAGL